MTDPRWKFVAVVALLALLVVCIGESEAAEKPRPWRQHLAMHMQTPKINTPTEVSEVLDERRDEIRAGWESWRADYQNHLEYEEALRATEILPAEETSPSSIEPVFAPTGASHWDSVVKCEAGSHGGWSLYTTGNGYYFGLQFAPSTWTGYGGPAEYLSNGLVPSRELQIAVAERVLAAQGPGAWPNCY